MAYATVEKFVATVGDAEACVLAVTVPPSASYDPDKIQGALDRQSAQIDTYLATRLETPLASVPAVVEAACIILAREELDRTGRDVVTKAADRVRAWLKDVAKGVATLGVSASSPEAPAPAGDGGGVLIDSPPRVFDEAGLAGYLGSYR